MPSIQPSTLVSHVCTPCGRAERTSAGISNIDGISFIETKKLIQQPAVKLIAPGGKPSARSLNQLVCVFLRPVRAYQTRPTQRRTPFTQRQEPLSTTLAGKRGEKRVSV